MVEGNFRSPILEDFIIPPTLSEETKGKTILAKNLPKQTDIDRQLAVLNRKILTRSRFPDGFKKTLKQPIHIVLVSKIFMNI